MAKNILAIVFLLSTLGLTIRALDPLIGRPLETLSVLGLDTLWVDFPYIRDNLKMLFLYQTDNGFDSEIRRLSLDGNPRRMTFDDDKLMARMYFYGGQIAKSEQLYSDLLLEFPNDRDILKGFGLLRMRQGELQNCDRPIGTCIYPRVLKHQNPAYVNASLHFFERANAIHPSADIEWVMRIARLAGSEPVTKISENAVMRDSISSLPVLQEAFDGPEITLQRLTRGVVTGDFNGNGRLDVVTASTKFPMGFYVNDGERKFSDRSTQSGLAKITNAFIVTAGDIDNDGDLDLYVSRNAFYGRMGNVMLRNDGHGRFADITEFSGTGNPGASFVSAFSDYDLDGDLDLFVANFSSPLRFSRGAIAENYGHHSNALYQNQGDGRFDEVTKDAGLISIDSHLGAAWGDIDEDGDPDLYVTTNFGPNRLYRNNGDGRFDDISRNAGVREPWSSFSGWFFDYDNDSHLDLLVTAHAPTKIVAAYNLDGKIPKLARSMRLYQGDGKGGFRDVTEAAGLRVASASMGANWGDINRDGHPDFYLGTGGPPLERLEPNLLFINQGNGIFSNTTESTGTGMLQKGHGTSFADLDGDGWQDLYVGLGGAWPIDAWGNTLFWNDTGAESENNQLIRVVLRGRQSNSHGVGARIVLKADARTLIREISAGGGFGVNPFVAEFGIGSATNADSLEINWPGGGRQTFKGLPGNATIIVDENNQQPLIVNHKVSSPMFGWNAAALTKYYGLKP